MPWVQKLRTEKQGAGRETLYNGCGMIINLNSFVKDFFPVLEFFNELPAQVLSYVVSLKMK